MSSQESTKLPRSVKDIVGSVFGRLTVVSFDSVKSKASRWLCRCVCGNEKVVSLKCLKKKTRSCGCLKMEKMFVTHGNARSKSPTKEYSTWVRIISRCHNENNKSYPKYGARGISVCQRWRNSADTFLMDVGKAPTKNHSLERIDNDGDYEPSNCRWATAKEQARNRRSTVRISFNGEMACVAEVAERLGVGMKMLHKQIKKHGVKDAIDIISWANECSLM